MTFIQKQVAAGKGVTIGARAGTRRGVLLIEVWHPKVFSPVGTSWVRWRRGRALELLWSATHPDYQKLGVRTRLHRWMLARLKPALLFTEAATEPGARWLTKAGFSRVAGGAWVMPV